MKKFLFLIIALLLMSGQGWGQTAGDIAIIGVNTDATKGVVFVALAEIPANTTITFTDNAWTTANGPFATTEGAIEWSHTSAVSAGTVVTITLGTPYTVNVGTITNNTTFNLSTSGDQIFVLKGAWADRPTNDGNDAKFLYGFSIENFITTGSTSSNTSYLPAGLASYSAAMTTSATEVDNAYFANGSSALTTVSVSGTKAELLVLLNDASLYYPNNTGPLTFPTYTINVNSGTLSPPTLIADATNNNVDNNIDISFTEDATWRGAITSVEIGGLALNAADYDKTNPGTLRLKPIVGNSLLTTSGSKSVTVIATGYADATVTQQIDAGATTSNSISSIDLVMAPGANRTITCTAKDQYNNLVPGYTFVYDVTVTNNDATTAESYTIDGATVTATTTNVSLVATTDVNGEATFDVILPATIDGNDGLSIQVQLVDGSTNVGSAFTFTQLQSQIITFGALSTITYGDSPFIVSATGGGSGNPVIFSSSDDNIATCTGTNGTTITIVANGNCTIYANQAGNGSYNAAPQVGQSLTVNQKALTIPDAVANNKPYDGNNTATITGTLSGKVGSDVVTFNGTGTFADVNVANNISVNSTCTLAGADYGKYSLTQPTGLMANITQATQTITFNALTNKILGNAPFNLTATATSGLTVTYQSSDLNVATILGNQVTIVGIGSTTITASQVGDGNYLAATDVLQNLGVIAPPIAAWTFDATPAAPSTPSSVAANYGTQSGTAMLFADGTNGSSTWITATIGNELSAFAGTTINDPRDPAIAGYSYCPVGGTGTSANGKSMVIKFSMTNYIDPVLNFATRGTSTGFNTHQWEWSTDNITYTPFGTNTAVITTSFVSKTIDMSSIDEIDQAATVYLRVTFSGATNSSGNNRLDNIGIFATEKPLTPVTTVTQPSCTVASGTITITAPTGMNYSIDGIDYSNTSGVFSGLAPNTYSVTAKSGSGAVSDPASVTINALLLVPDITLSATSVSAISGGTGNLPYGGTTGSPVSYSIVYDAAALSAGFMNVTDEGLLAGQISVAISGTAPVATYNAVLTVKNGNGCESVGYAITVKVMPALTISQNIGTTLQASCTPVSGAYYYTFRYRLKPGGSWIGISSLTNYVKISNLTQGKTYECILYVYNSLGQPLGYYFLDDFNTFTTTYTPSYDIGTTVQVDWSDFSPWANFYLLQYKKSIDANWLNSSGSTLPQKVLYGLDPFTDYDFRVIVYKNGNYWGTTEKGTFKTGQTIFTFTNITSSSADIEWTSYSPWITGQAFRWKTELATVWNSAPQYLSNTRHLTGLLPSTDYVVQIWVYKSVNWGPTQISQKFTTLGAKTVGSNATGNDVNVYPNPFTDEVNLDFFTEEGTVVNWNIYDMTGRLILSGNEGVTSGYGTLNIDATDLPKGVYMLNAMLNDQMRSFRIVKQ